MKYKATEKNEGTYLMREDEVEDNGNGVLWSMLLFFFSGFRVLILCFFLPRPLLCFFFVSVPCVIRLPLVLCFQCSSSCSFSLFRYLPLRFCLRFSAPVFCFVLPWVLSLVFLWFFSSSRRCVFFSVLPSFVSVLPPLSQSAALLLLRSCADGMSLNVITRSRMMLWRKTVVAAIAGLSCCRRRKWWLRSTCCHCFNGEENKNSRCWVWTERLPWLKTKLLFMLWKPAVVVGAHAGRLTIWYKGRWYAGEEEVAPLIY